MRKFFTKLRRFVIKQLGGYHEGEILREAMEDIYTLVRADDILKRDENGNITLEGKPLIKGQVEGLKEQADAFLKSQLNKILDREFKHHVNLQLRKATTTEQLENAKLLEYTWDVVKTILKYIKNIQ